MGVIKVNHSKYKNTGILFELLTKQITNDIMSGKKSPATNILKKYFVNTELSKEYKLYESFFKNRNLTESKANIVIDTISQLSNSLDKTKLRSDKYNLIKEIKRNYNLDDFFKHSIPNYRDYAMVYTLLENTNPSVIIESKANLMAVLTSVEEKDVVMESFAKEPKDLRLIAYRMLLEKFNSKYKGLSQYQKTLLREYITLTDSKVAVVEFYNTNITKLKNDLVKERGKVTDKVTKIKLDEVLKMLKPITVKSKITEDAIVDLLSYIDLVTELKRVHE